MAAAAAAARSVFRSSSIRSMVTRLSSETRASRPPLRAPKPQRPAALPPPPRILRSPVEMSFCVESLLPMHSVTAAALMNSMLSVPGNGYGWLLEAGNDDV